jgi:hypothetical protein
LAFKIHRYLIKINIGLIFGYSAQISEISFPEITRALYNLRYFKEGDGVIPPAETSRENAYLMEW